jgi:hypothetical protein
VRFREFLRVAVLLFGGAATALATVSIVGVARDVNTGLAIFAVTWWVGATVIGLWLGRRVALTPGISRLLASARTTPTLPELDPGAVLFNRLWPLAVLAVASGVLGFFIPQVPAVATGYALLAAMWWRKQSAAVAAIEDRDGVQFWFDRSSPFGAPQLVRTPGLRRIEPTPGDPARDQEPAPL